MIKNRGAHKSNYNSLLEEQKGLCNICRCKLSKSPGSSFPVVDHIKPLGLLGSDNYDNLQLICNNCHLIKTAVDLRNIWDFRKNNKHKKEVQNGKR